LVQALQLQAICAISVTITEHGAWIRSSSGKGGGADSTLVADGSLNSKQSSPKRKKNCLLSSSEITTPGMQAWINLPPKQLSNMHPKLAVLMFAKDSVGNEFVWKKWIKDAERDGLKFQFLIHAYGIEHPAGFKTRDLEKFVVPEKVETKWCDMWEAQMLLIRRALDDPEVSHVMVVSDDSIPVKSLSSIHGELSHDPRTQMCADDNWDKRRAETWFLMRREDAELFRDNKDMVKAEFVGGGLKPCTEENSWYNPLRLRMQHWGARASIRNACPMFTEWKLGWGCKQWSDHSGLCECPSLRAGNITPADDAHPATFHRINSSAFQELVRSPFWFARKFSPGSVDIDDGALKMDEAAASQSHRQKDGNKK